MTRVVVIGSGVVGASIAFHLASRGCRDVVVLDRGAGEASTLKATGGFRTQFATETNVKLSLLSRRKLLAFADEVGADAGYRPCGYLFLARAEHLAAMRAALNVQRAAGLEESKEVVPGPLNPAASMEGIAAGFYCPLDGFIRPRGIREGYLAAARGLGVRVESGVAVTGFRRDGARIVEAETTKGTRGADVFVNAAGAWAAKLAGIPVTPLKRQVAATVFTSVLPDSMPMTIWLEDGFHLRVRDGRVLLLMPHETPSSFDTAFDESWIAGVVERARQRVPCLKDVAIDREACWAGLYEMSPDRHAILGFAPETSNFLLANGSSGHGVMHAPALGELAAQMILGETPSLDVSALRPSRFVEGRMNPVDGLL